MVPAEKKGCAPLAQGVAPGSPPPQSPRADYLPFVDGLRAIAVLAVIAYHLRESWLPGGFAGVDVFFVISGFVVSASVSGWNRGGLPDLLAYFYARRMQRIAPALVLCLLVTSLASAMLIPAAWLSSSNDLTGLFAFVGLSNFYLAANNENYFSPSTEFNPFTHTWSLGVEEQFYLLFPFLFFAWTRGGRWRFLSVGLFSIALVASLGDAWQRAQSDQEAAFFLISTRFWQLAAGVLLYLCMGKPSALDTRSWKGNLIGAAGAWLSFALLAWSLWTSDPAGFPFPGAWMPVTATLGLLGFLYRSPSHSLLLRWLCSRWMLHIGKRSYALYLWHWPVLVLLRWTSGIDSAVAIATALVLTVVFAETSYRYVESPLRYAPALRQWPRMRVIRTGLVGVGACAVLAVALAKGKPVISLSTVMRHDDAWYPAPLPNLDDVPGCTLHKSKPRNVDVAVRIYSRAGCETESIQAPDVFALGDSHALAYVTMLSEYVLRTGAEVSLYPNLGCSFANLRSGSESDACMTQEQLILDDIAMRAKPGDVLFLASLRLNRFSDQDGRPVPNGVLNALQGAPAEQIRRDSEARLEPQLRPLVEAGIRIVFEAPKPLLPSPAFRCSDVFNARNPVCSPGLTAGRSSLESYRRPVVASLDRLAARLGASVWDPFPLLCPGIRCGASLGSHPIFFDGDHISAYANRLLYPSFAGFIMNRRRPAG